MAVDEVLRAIPVQQGQEGLKPAVGEVVRVAAAARRRVRQHDVHAPGARKLQAQALYAPLHLPLGVLMRAARVHRTAAEAEYAQTVHSDELPVHAVAALRRRGGIGGVVVAGHVQERAVRHGDKEAEIACLQVARGQYHIYPGKPAGRVVIPKIRAFFVGHDEYFQS